MYSIYAKITVAICENPFVNLMYNLLRIYPGRDSKLDKKALVIDGEPEPGDEAMVISDKVAEITFNNNQIGNVLQGGYVL